MLTLEQKNRYMRHQIAVLEAILMGNKPSDFSTKIGIDSEYFVDSCRHSDLYYSVSQFVETLKTIVKYNEIIIAADKKES